MPPNHLSSKLSSNIDYTDIRSVSPRSALSIIYFGNDWFAENRTSSHHIARRLGNLFPLVYVESPGLRSPKISRRDVRKILKKSAMLLRGPRQLGPHFWHMSVPQIPFRRFYIIRKLNEVFAEWRVLSAIRKLSLDSPISWFTVPHPGFLAGRFCEKLVVYYCVDNYATLPDVNPAEVAQMDELLTRRANVVFAVSQAVFASKQKQNNNVIYAPHGVDADLFGRAEDTSRPVPRDVRDVCHPVIGFFGLLDRNFDSGLVAFLARQRPGWTFLLLGRVASDLSELADLPNVRTVGPVPYEALPDWARTFDVCIMPYRPNAHMAYASPLKLREYLSTGRPVVSIPVSEIDRFSSNVSFARTKEGFLQAIEKELASDSPEKRKSRMQLVKSDTWDARVEDILSAVQKALNEQA